MSIGNVTQITLNHDVEYHVSVLMPNGKQQEWLLTARDAVTAAFRAERHKSLLPKVDGNLHSPLWKKLLRRMKD